jgi:uncharacterized protein (TIGR02217 family)
MAYGFLPAQQPGLASAYALNANPKFARTGAPVTGVPYLWNNWNDGAATINSNDGAGVAWAEIRGQAAQSGGVYTLIGGNTPATGSQAFPGQGWYILEADFNLISGALTGAGMRVEFDDAAYGTTYESANLTFSTDPDIFGAVNGAGTVGNRYRYNKLVQVRNPLSVAAALYAMSHWSGLGSVAAANLLGWYRCLLRPATFAEVAQGNAQYGLPVFPVMPGQAIEVSKAPLWNTTVKTSKSGRDFATPNWSYPLWVFDLSFNVLRHRPSNDELSALWTFFNTIQGRNQVFLFMDPTDYISPGITDQFTGGFATGDGSTTVFQVFRFLLSGYGQGGSVPVTPNQVVEPCYAPFGMTLTVNGSPVVLGTDFTIGPHGLITFTAAPSPGAVIAWEGDFYFGCRMLQDDLTADQIVNQLWSGKSLKFRSQRV